VFRRLALFAFATVLALVGPAAVRPIASANAPLPPSWCPSTGPLMATQLPAAFSTTDCPVEGRTIKDRTVGAVVPEPGVAVFAESYGVGDATDQLVIEHSSDGVIYLGYQGLDAAQKSSSPSGTVTPASPDPNEGQFAPECTDEANQAFTYFEDDTHNWFVNTSTYPTDLTSASISVALIEGTKNIENVRSTCNETVFGDYWNRDSSLNTNFAGQTTLLPNIDLNGCTNRDSVNTVGFDARPAGVLATNCSWYYPLINDVIEADVEFERSAYSWTTSPGSLTCLGRYDIESVMTHERGHSFGLDHVSELTSPRMTMSPNIDGTCQSQERSLGLGDALGLSYKY